jgi:hypothetical protein
MKMLGKGKIVFVFVVLVLECNFKLFASGIPVSQVQDTLLSSSIKLFNSGEYFKASSGFQRLLPATPDDEMLNYYLGASFVEQGIFTDETIKYLLKAITGNTPDKVFYYTGKYYQTKEQWNSALKYYNRFRNFGAEADKEAVGIDRLIDFCYGKANGQPVPGSKEKNAEKGTTTVSQPLKSDIVPEESPGSIKKEDVQPASDSAVVLPGSGKEEDLIQNPGIGNAGSDSTQISQPLEPGVVPTESADTIKEIVQRAGESVVEKPAQKQPENFVPIHFIVNPEIEYLKPENFRSSQALEFFNQGNEAGIKLQNDLNELDSLRQVYSRVETGKESIAARIILLEQESLALKYQRDDLLSKSRALEQDFWSGAGEIEIAKFREEISTLKQQLAQKAKEPAAAPNEIVELQDTVVAEPIVPVEVKKEATTEKEKIVYKIQIGSFNRKMPESTARLFKKLEMLRTLEHFKDERGYTIYTTGNLSNFDDAVKMQGQVRQEGVKDAFIVAYKNGKRIPVNEARSITPKK